MISPTDSITISQLLKLSALVQSTSDARRLIQQGAVRIDNVRIDDETLILKKGRELTLQVGKRRIARVRVD